jgi:hypothetical protein
MLIYTVNQHIAMSFISYYILKKYKQVNLLALFILKVALFFSSPSSAQAMNFENMLVAEQGKDTLISNLGEKNVIFIFDPKDNISMDDGVIIIVRDGKRYKRNFTGPVDITWFGAKGDFDGQNGTDNTSAFKKCFSKYKDVFIPKGNYKTGIYPRANGINVTGEIGTTISLFRVSTPVMVQFGNNSKHSDIKFVSLESDLENQRAGVEQASNVILQRCGFFKFRDTGKVNAWGLYLKNAKNITIDRCNFGNNSQSDIALVDNCRDVNITSPTNDTDSGVSLNIEPNGSNGTKGAKISGGVYRSVTLLENSYVAYASENIVFNSCTINSLKYDGSGASFSNCIITTVSNESNKRAYMGELDIEATLSTNLIGDARISDVSSAQNLSSFWRSSSKEKTTTKPSQLKSDNSTYKRLNQYQKNTTDALVSIKPIKISGKLPLLVFVNGRSVIPKGAGWIGQNLHIVWLNKNNQELSRSQTPFARGMPGDTTAFKNNFAVLVPPANAVSVRIEIGHLHKPSNIITDLQGIGLFEIKKLGSGRRLSEIAKDIVKVNKF